MSDMSTITKEWITVAAAAQRLKCSARTVLRLADSGAIEKVEVNPRMYLVRAKDVEAEANKGQSFGRPRGS